MNKMREALRLILQTTMSNRMIGRTIGLSHNTVSRYRDIVVNKDHDWSSISDLDDTEIETLLQSKRGRLTVKCIPDWHTIHEEHQKPFVTLQLLWEEYRLTNPENAYSYSQFTHYYRLYVGKLDRTMRHVHRAGEIVFVDFAGKTIPYTDLSTNKERKAQVFVGVLGCSNYTFAYAVPSQSTQSWIEAHNRMYQYFGGIPQVVVPDNLKAAVIRTGSEPKINRTYLEQSKYYGLVVIPARAYKPRDKAKAEGGVLLVSRWILAKLRHQKFFSIEEINAAIAELLWQLNERPFKRLPGCRRSRFVELDKPMLTPLPGTPFEYSEWTAANKVGPDHHMLAKDHYYSVPHELVGERVEARITGKTVELFLKGRRVASHPRSDDVGGHSTLMEHLPKAHRLFADQTPEKYLNWAKKLGPAAEAAVQHQFECRPHPLLGLRACGTLQRLAKAYGDELFEAACRRGKSIGSLTVKSIRSILQRGLSEQLDEQAPIQINLPLHQNVRGSSYYSLGGE